MKTKVCSKCGEEYLLSAFYFRNNKPRASCIFCHKEYSKVYYRKSGNAKTNRSKQILYKYKITSKDYSKLFSNQKSRCAICNKKSKHKFSLCVDHCHKTGKVRGLICRKCNFGLGNFSDSIKVLKRAITYLEK